MTSLADKLRAIEPVTCSFSVSNGVYVSKEPYTQMRDIAVLLAEALSLYAKQDNSSNMFIVDYVSPSVACEAIAKAQAMLTATKDEGSGDV